MWNNMLLNCVISKTNITVTTDIGFYIRLCVVFFAVTSDRIKFTHLKIIIIKCKNKLYPIQLEQPRLNPALSLQLLNWQNNIWLIVLLGFIVLCNFAIVRCF